MDKIRLARGAFLLRVRRFGVAVRFDKAVALDVSAFGVKAASLSATVLSGSSPDDYNDIGAENRVVPVKTALAVKDGRVQLAPHSLNCIVLD